MKLKRRRIKRGRIEIIPMIDTIVILLIFYMSFSRFAAMSSEGAIKLPDARAGTEFKKLPNQLIVNMFSATKLTVGGQPYNIDQLPGVLNGFRQANRSVTNVSVILRAEKNMSYKDLSAFMKACSTAKIIDVTFATLENR
jgi:biopolymer transport protein ExbD